MGLDKSVGKANGSAVVTILDLIERAGGVSKLARLCHVHHSTVCDWKRGNFLPGNRLPCVSRALGIDPASLFPLVKTPPKASRAEAA